MASVDPGSAIISLLGGFLQGASSPQQFQTKLPFTGAADPNPWLGELHNTIASLLNGAGEDVANNPHVSAPGMGAYQPHGTMAQATRFSTGPQSGTAPAAVGPQRRPSAFNITPGTVETRSPLDSDTVTALNTNGTYGAKGGAVWHAADVKNAANPQSPDYHAANLALLALHGVLGAKPVGSQQAGT